MSTAPDKQLSRKTALAARKQAFDAHGPELADAISALLDEIGPITGQVIAGYMPMRSELSPLSAMAALAEQNRICVPVIEAKATPLRFREWSPDAEMSAGEFGAMIPVAGPWLTPDIVIVPLVGFDKSGNRLGYGGGFYDRTLEQLRAQRPLRAIGFSYAAQELAPLTPEPTDQPLDAIVTETGVIRP